MKEEIELGDATLSIEGDATVIAGETAKFYTAVQQISAAHIAGNAEGTMPSVAPQPPAPVIAPVVAPVAPVMASAAPAPAPSSSGSGNGGSGSASS